MQKIKKSLKIKGFIRFFFLLAFLAVVSLPAVKLETCVLKGIREIKIQESLPVSEKVNSFLKQAFLITKATEISKPNSVGAVNYYELKPNPHFISLGVKGYQQTDDATCGPAAVMSLLRWYNMLDDSQMNHETEMRIAKEMGTGTMASANPGTKPEQMAAWLQKNGFTVVWGTDGTLDMLKKNLAEGVPTLVEWIDWGGHWVVVTGYYAQSQVSPKEPDTIFFADPAVRWLSGDNPDGISSFNARRFADMWFDAQYYKPGQLVRNVYIVAYPKSLLPTKPSARPQMKP